jgi:hypothetical protein
MPALDPSRAITAATRTEDARSTMSLSRSQFAIRAMEAGLITPEEAEEWAAGNALPAVLLGAIETFPAGQARARARIEAKAAVEIRRTHPLVVGMAAAMGLTDAQVDALYG